MGAVAAAVLALVLYGGCYSPVAAQAATVAASADQQFYVAFPKLIHSGSNTTVWVHRQSSTEATAVACQGNLDVLKENTDTKVVPSMAFMLMTTQKLSLSLPSSVTGAVRLRVRITQGFQGQVFLREAKVDVHPAERLIFVQTDKPIYKPGDLVRLRVVSVRMDTLSESDRVRGMGSSRKMPVYYKTIQVAKPSRRLISMWKMKSWQQGFEGMEFRLPADSRQIELGFYTITVQLKSGEMVKSKFQVKKYVLPTFTVDVIPPKYILVTNKNIAFQVCAKYTFGKPVLGRAKANVCQGNTICRDVTQTLGRNGCANFDIRDVQFVDRNSFSPRNRKYPARYTFNATVYEEGTGKFVATKSAKYVSIIDKPFRLAITSAKYFWPGLPYAGTVQATRHDGTPFPNPRVRISLRERWWWNGRAWGFETVEVGDQSGKVQFQLPSLPSSMKSVYITVHSDGYKEERINRRHRYNYMGEVYKGFSLQKRSTASGSGMVAQITAISNAAGCAVGLAIQLTANVPLHARALHVQLASRGQVIHWQSFAPLTSGAPACINQDGLYGHYQCSASGKARCLAGWTGNDCMAPICAGGCLNNGVCVAPNKCLCGRGFTGPNCQTCVKSYGCRHGRCIGNRRCICYFPYTGYNCQIQNSNYNWERLPRGPGQGGMNRSEWILPEEDPTYGVTPTYAPPPALIQAKQEQNITINFRNIEVSLDGSVPSGARLVVFSVNASGEVLADSQHLKQVSSCLPNDATRAEFQLRQVQPGRTLNLALSTSGGGAQCALSVSDVGLSALADAGSQAPSRANLLKKIEELQNEVYESSVGLYDDANYCRQFIPTPKPTTNTMRRRYWPRSFYRPDFHDATFSFNDAGILLLTNQRLRSAPCSRREIMYTARAFSESQADDEGRRAMPRARNNRRKKNKLATRVRQLFPESWLWSSFRMGADEQRRVMTVTAPDSITSWRAEFLCVSESGLGVAPPAKLTVFQPFFLQLALPFAAVSGERLRLPVSVHSYSDACYRVDVTFQRNIMSEVDALDGTERQLCMCSADRPKVTATFDLRFLRPQNQSMLFHATARPASAMCGGSEVQRKNAKTVLGATDAVRRYINVLPEGVPESATQSALLCGKGQMPTNVTFRLRAPQNTVPSSLSHYLSWTGDIMGPTLTNLANLVRMPYGCGEQNMATMVPSIFVLKYLSATGTGSSELKANARRYIREGYYRELKYRHADGSFSAYGARDAHGSTWLTAFVVRSFYEAAQFYSGVDANGTVSQAVNFLISQQDSVSGCFNERGRVFSSYLQGGGGQASRLALTAYVLPAIAAHMRRDSQSHYKMTQVQRGATRCLIDGDFITGSNYLLALSTYALSEIPQQQGLLARGRARIRDNLRGDYNDKFLPDTGRPVPTRPPRSWWRPRRTSAEVETTAYALLALSGQSGTFAANLPLVRWLSAQRNAFGGWRSTQDTIVSLRALAQFGAILAHGYRGQPIKLKLKINVEKRYSKIQQPEVRSALQISDANSIANEVIEYTITDENRLLEKVQKLNRFTQKIRAQINGTGCVVLVANTLFNLPSPVRPEAPFTVSLSGSTRPGRCAERRLRIAVRYRGAEDESGMALIRLRLPTGWYVEETEGRRLLNRYSSSGVKRVEVDGQTAEMYLDSILKSREQVFQVNIKRKHIVRDLKPSVVTVADYYRPELNREVMLDIGDCQEAAETTAEPPAPTPLPDAPPSCPACASADANLTATRIMKLLCSKWSAFVLAKRIENQERSSYRVMRPQGIGAIAVWDVSSLQMAPACYALCPLLQRAEQPKVLLLVSRYSYRGGIWPGSLRLTPDSSFLLADADTPLDLARRVAQLPSGSGCPNRVTLLALAAIEKRRQEELAVIKRANLSRGGCPLCSSQQLSQEKKASLKKRLCDAYSKSSTSLRFNRLFTAKEKTAAANGAKLYNLESIGNTQQLDVQFTMPPGCVCAPLSTGAGNGRTLAHLFVVPPEGWTPRSKIALDRGYALIPVQEARPMLVACRTPATTTSPISTTEAAIEASGSNSADEQSDFI